jgi:hypothetical protein
MIDLFFINSAYFINYSRLFEVKKYIDYKFNNKFTWNYKYHLRETKFNKFVSFILNTQNYFYLQKMKAYKYYVN